MTFKSPTQPLCRYCAKPIPKATTFVWFGQGERQGQQPTSKAGAQRLVNEQVISVSWHRYLNNPERDHIASVGAWDGESYRDEFFCTQAHAVAFAYAAVRHTSGLAMPAYHTAIEKRDLTK